MQIQKLLCVCLIFIHQVFIHHILALPTHNSKQLISDWLFRTDGQATNTILSNNTIELYLPKTTNNFTVYNAEIYNNPCCLHKLPKCLDIDYTLYPIPLETQVCDMFHKVCRHTKNNDKKCKLYNAGFIIDSPTNPFQLIKDQFINLPYLYGEFNISVYVESSAKNGSFGFGLWNTNMTTVDSAEFIWFMHFDQPEAITFNGFWAMLVKHDYYKMIKLPDFMFDSYETYSIIWNETNIKMLINGKIVCDIDNINFSNNLAYHTWIDNVQYNLVANGSRFDWDLKLLELHEPKKILIQGININI